jgi:hypothetical protein
MNLVMRNALEFGGIHGLSKAEMRQYIAELRADFMAADVINRRGDRVVLRWLYPGSQNSVIIKLWTRRTFKNSFRHMLRRAPCHLEWRSLRHLSSCGVAVPRPLGFCRVVPDIAGFTEALFMEDLGICETGTDYLKRLIRMRDERGVELFEELVVRMTRQIVEGGMLDEDHGLLNIVVQSSGRPVRLDLELCRWVHWPRLFPRTYGRMLGRLIGLHAFAVQPDMERAARFAGRLREQLKPPDRVLLHAGAHARSMMKRQLEKTGIGTDLALPWE